MLPVIRRRQRLSRALCEWLAAALLITQMLTSAYACPRLAAATAAEGSSSVDCMGATPMQMDPAQPLLCKAHCEAGSQSANAQTVSLDVPSAAAACTALVGVLRVDESCELEAAMSTSTAHGPPAGTTPIYLRLLVLRN